MSKPSYDDPTLAWVFGSIRHRKQSQAVSRGQRRHIPHVLTEEGYKKSCSKCASLKPLTAFKSDPAKWDGLYSSCMECNPTPVRSPKKKVEKAKKVETIK